MIDLKNKAPKGYIEASFGGYDKDGLVVIFDNIELVPEQYSFALYNSKKGIRELAKNSDNVIDIKNLSAIIKADEEWNVCIVYEHNGKEKAEYLRQTGLKIQNVCKEEMYDRRTLYGDSFTLLDGKELLTSYQLDGIMTLSMCDSKTYIYMSQIKNEIISEYMMNEWQYTDDDVEDDESDDTRRFIEVKCKKIRGSYIGIVPANQVQYDNLRDNCIEYRTYKEVGDYVNMDFAIPEDNTEEQKEYYVLWSFRGQDYIAPICKKQKKQFAKITKLKYVKGEGLRVDVSYKSEIVGEFVKAEFVSNVERWEEECDIEISEYSSVTVLSENKISLMIDTIKAFTAMGSWCLKVHTVLDNIETVLDVTVADKLISKDINDGEDTKHKIAFKKKDELFVISRTFGHNALFKKNIQADGDMTLEEFLTLPEVSLKGNMYGEYVEEADGLKIRLYQQMKNVVEAKLVMFHSQGMGVLSTQDIVVVDGVIKEIVVETPDIDWDKKFSKPVDSVWFRVGIAIRTPEGIYLSTLTNYDMDTKVDQQGNLHDSRRLYLSALLDNTICDINMTAVPYYAGNKSLSMKYVRPEQLYRSQFTNELLDVKIKKDILIVKMRCRKCIGIYKGVMMEYRKVKEDDVETYLIPYETLVEEGDSYIMTTRIDMKKYYMRMLYWDIRCAFEVDGKLYNVSCHSNNKKFLRKYKNVFVDRTYPNDNSIMFPFATGSNSVALMHREVCPQDNWRFRLKEKFAEKLYKWFKNHWDKKKIYLIFEKYCTMAQDNGYFFFKYCMDANVEAEFDGEIYYVIDRKAADWDKVVPYRKHVLKYLSVKHMIYLQACKLMISTDTKGHAYVWRSMGSDIKALTYKKKLVFLQHGVTAFKRGHFERGTNVGCESFITTSQFEHDIIRDYLGYPEHEIPITGFARWDVLHDKSEGHREILMMPTWRTWLDDAENEVFAESDYCKNYMALLNDPRLDDILKRYDVTLNFYLHPKFRKFITEFSVVSDNIRLIPFGEEPLNELMMECNLLITDFSSVAWDVYYMNKPVLFYHFDLDDAYKTLGFYMDMRNDIFGERAEEPEELMQLIIEYIENGFVMKEKYSKDREKYFAYVDDNNSERIWKAIQERKW